MPQDKIYYNNNLDMFFKAWQNRHKAIVDLVASLIYSLKLGYWEAYSLTRQQAIELLDWFVKQKKEESEAIERATRSSGHGG